MIEFDEETVVRHPFAGWVPDRAGNPSNRPQFGSDMAIERALYADADSGEPPDGLHSAVEVRANLYLPPGTATDPHDEWTARGQRWRQLGAGKVWRSSRLMRAGVVVTLVRRTG